MGLMDRFIHFSNCTVSVHVAAASVDGTCELAPMVIKMDTADHHARSVAQLRVLVLINQYGSEYGLHRRSDGGDGVCPELGSFFSTSSTYST